MVNGLVRYQTDHGEVSLSSDTIRRYLVPSGANVTDQEVKIFSSIIGEIGTTFSTNFLVFTIFGLVLANLFCIVGTFF